MSVFRPSNINKRLVGTATTSKILSCPIFSGKGSPGNGGQIGPRKTPYCCGAISLGCRCNGGSCGGIFKLNESGCGVNESCKSSVTDCGFFICCGPSTTKWFVASSCTQVTRCWNNSSDAVTVANSCLGSCAWFVPNSTQLQNPGNCCRVFWDSYTDADYWSSTAGPTHTRNHQTPDGQFQFSSVPRGVATNFPAGTNSNVLKDCLCNVRAFRCV